MHQPSAAPRQSPLASPERASTLRALRVFVTNLDHGGMTTQDGVHVDIVHSASDASRTLYVQSEDPHWSISVAIGMRHGREEMTAALHGEQFGGNHQQIGRMSQEVLVKLLACVKQYATPFQSQSVGQVQRDVAVLVESQLG